MAFSLNFYCQKKVKNTSTIFKERSAVIMTLVKANNGWYPTVNHMFDDFFGDNWLMPRKTHASLPAVNVVENGDSYAIEMAAPGYEKADFKVHVEHDVLSISVEKQEEQSSEEKNYARKEFTYSSFERRFSLPKDQVDSDKIEAKYEQGILTVNLPKREEVKPKPARAIEIH